MFGVRQMTDVFNFADTLKALISTKK